MTRPQSAMLRAPTSRTKDVSVALSPSQETVKKLQTSLLRNQVGTDFSGFDSGAAFVHHSSVLMENELGIGILPQNDAAVPLSRVSQSQIDRGATVLTLLEDFAGIQRYIEK